MFYFSVINYHLEYNQFMHDVPNIDSLKCGCWVVGSCNYYNNYKIFPNKEIYVALKKYTPAFRSQ